MELLSDPFLIADDGCIPLPTLALKAMDIRANDQKYQYVPVCDGGQPVDRTDMTITGKMNPENDTIFLKVQIADKSGEFLHLYR